MFNQGWKTRRNAARARAHNQLTGSSSYREWRDRQLQREAIGRRLADLVIRHAALVAEQGRLIGFIISATNRAIDAGRELDEAAPAVLQARHRLNELVGLIVASERAVEHERADHAVAIAAHDSETARLEAAKAGDAADQAIADAAARAAFEEAKVRAREHREANAIIVPAAPDEDDAAPTSKPRARKTIQ